MMTQAEAVTGWGSYARGEGSLSAQARLLWRLGYYSALMMRKVTLVTAVMKAGKGKGWQRGRRRQHWDAGHGWAGSGELKRAALEAQGTAGRGRI